MLWHLRLPDRVDSDAFGLLDATEQVRAAAIASPTLRAHYVASHAELRRILGAETGTDPDRLRFRPGAHGKPALCAYPDLRFNLSHSGAHAVIALSRDTEVGVDVEQRRPNRQARRIVSRLFADEERAALEGLDDVTFTEGFARLWVLKEAFIKADGRGLALPLRDFAICPFRGRLLRTEGNRMQGAALRYLTLGHGIDCALVGIDCSALDMTLIKLQPETFSSRI